MHLITVTHRLRNFAGRIALVGGLGWCALAHATMPEITSPAPGAVVSAPVAVEVKYFDIEYCDTAGCFPVPTESLELFDHADTEGMFLDSCDTKTVCPGGMASFEVALAPGGHALRVIASDGQFSIEASKLVDITVEAAPEATTGDNVTTGDNGSTTDAGTTGGSSTTGATTARGDGCGCTSGDGSGGGLVCLAALMLLVPRRR